MGINIYCQGQLDKPQQWSLLVDEMKLMADKLGWPFQEVDRRILGISQGFYKTYDKRLFREETRQVDDRLRGICLQPPDIQAVCITFNRAGELNTYWDLPHPVDNEELGLKNQQEYTHLEQLCFITTGSVESHIKICAILNIIKEKYISNLSVTDETTFYETKDYDKLVEAHGMSMAFVEFIKGWVTELNAVDTEGENPVTVETNVSLSSKPHPLKPKWGDTAHEN